MKYIKYIIFLILIAVLSQNSLKTKPNFDDSKLYFLSKEEVKALPLFYNLYEIYPEELNKFDTNWYRAGNIKVMFFRPVSSLLHILELKLGLWGFQGALVINILWIAIFVYLFHQYLLILSFSPTVAFWGTIFLISDFKNYEIIGWVSARCILYAGVLGLISLMALLKSDKVTKYSKFYFAISVITFSLAILSYEAYVSLIFYLFPLIYFSKNRDQRISRLAYYLGFIGIYLVIYFSFGGGGYSGNYLDPISNFTGYLNRLIHYYPDFLFKKISTNSEYSFDYYSPVWAFWILNISFALLLFYFIRKYFNGEKYKQARMLLASSLFIPVVYSMTVISSRALFQYSIGLNLFVAFLLTFYINYDSKTPRYLFYAIFSFVIVFNSVKAINFYQENNFYVNNAKCINNLNNFGEYLNSSQKQLVYLNEPPIIYHRLLAKNKFLYKKVLTTLSDVDFSELEMTNIKSNSFDLYSSNKHGLVRHIQPYLYKIKFVINQDILRESFNVKPIDLAENGIPKKINVLFNEKSPPFQIIKWREDCSYVEVQQ
ncbi:MAG: hypothetical protein K2Q18_18000 [Bdellovibrionales bacterium]|nr:hypothetical protein [Bdellovibrionales bacterium]